MSWLAYAQAAKELAPYAKAIGNAAESVASLNNDSGSDSGSNMNVGTTDSTPQYNTTPSYNTASAIKSAAVTKADDSKTGGIATSKPTKKIQASEKLSTVSNPNANGLTNINNTLDNDKIDRTRNLDAILNSIRPETEDERKARERAEMNSNLISGLGDAISGFVGLGFAAHGGQALNTNGKTALGGKLEEQERQRQERKANLQQYYTTKQNAYNQAIAELARKRQEQYENEARPYELRTKKANAVTAEANADTAKINASYAGQYQQSRINRNNQTGTKRTGSVKTNSKGDTIIPTSDGNYTIPKNSYKAVMSAAYREIPDTFHSSYVKRNQYDEEYRDVTKYDQIVMEYMNSPESIGDVNFWSHFGGYKANGTSASSSSTKKKLPGAGTQGTGATGQSDVINL